MKWRWPLQLVEAIIEVMEECKEAITHKETIEVEEVMAEGTLKNNQLGKEGKAITNSNEEEEGAMVVVLESLTSLHTVTRAIEAEEVAILLTFSSLVFIMDQRVVSKTHHSEGELESIWISLLGQKSLIRRNSPV